MDITVSFKENKNKCIMLKIMYGKQFNMSVSAKIMTDWSS